MTQSPDPPAATPARARVEGHELLVLGEGWQAAAAPPGSELDPAALEQLDWLAATVPGTAAGALRKAGLWRREDGRDLDAEDWWFRTDFAADAANAGEQVLLCLDGVATVASVYLNGELVHDSDSMFAAHAIDVGRRLRGHNTLAIRCRALLPLLQERRRPRARWRTRIVADGNLRFFRTMLLGRAPGFAPGPAAVGPWREVRLERRRNHAVEELGVRARLRGGDGVLAVRVALRPLTGAAPTSLELRVTGPSGSHSTDLELADDGGGALRAEAELTIPDVARWWPHTHGEPLLHEVTLALSGDEGLRIDAGRVGFRELAAGAEPGRAPETDGLDLHVNGVRVFVRGAVWTPVDPIGLAPSAAELRETLVRARDAGMNMLRVPGTSAYEQPAFFDLCDQLGILVWQDLMFANLDYPFADPDFLATVERELDGLLDAVAGRASLAVVCGNSEVEQQVAMLGLDPALGRAELYAERVPARLHEAAVDAVYLPSAPCGGELPFRTDAGVANYFGVGAYLRPLDDARRARVRFASECLAIANVPDAAGVRRVRPDGAPTAVHEPAWKAGVPRDAGADWDFEDVRDHYLRELFGVDAAELRSADEERYLELSRIVSGELMAEVFGEWRRAGSTCHGGLVLWLRDLVPGAGWGVLDERGEPKAAYHHLRRALAPVAVWTIDEGLGGIVVHVANDTPQALSASLRVALYSDYERPVGDAHAAVELAPHGHASWNVEQLLGRFVDASYAYRFGAPAQDAIVASLEAVGVAQAPLLGQAVRFPAGRPLEQEAPGQLAALARARLDGDGCVSLTLSSRRLLYGARIELCGYRPDDDHFSLEPGVERTITLRPDGITPAAGAGTLGAVNMRGEVHFEIDGERA